MKPLVKISIFIILLSGTALLRAEDAREKSPGTPANLGKIAGSIDAFKGKTVVMKLRLKVYDRIFEKIVFYDASNHDIEFSVEKNKISKRLQRELLNLHPGMTYRVRFKVLSVGALGLVNGELVSFSPRILERLP